MHSYNFELLNSILSRIIERHTSADSFIWLQEKAATSGTQFSTAFVALPRKTGKKLIDVTESETEEIKNARKGFTIVGWPTDRLARVWLLMQLDATDKEQYFKLIENLFLAAEMNELTALYSALPLLQHPELWKKRCAEGIRNNIGDVLEAVICNNPYPSENLDEAAWNQLVLKAFFTDKPVEQIIGLDERGNEKLASTLYDYAQERMSAHRRVNPILWRCVEPFLKKENISDYHKLKEYVLQS